MSDILKAFGITGTPTGPSYKHPLEENIIRETSTLLMKIPEGKRLLRIAKDNDIKFHAIAGRDPAYKVGDAQNLFLICPTVTAAINLEEMTALLALGLREIEQPTLGIHKPVPGSAGDLDKMTLNHSLDIIIELCKIADEFKEVTGSTKLVDLVVKLGHSELHRGIRSGLPHQELIEILNKSTK